MGGDVNVKIPLVLLDKTIDFLDCIDLSMCDKSLLLLYDDIYFAFINKKTSLCLRDSYSKIINAKDNDDRYNAKVNYLKQKQSVLFHKK